MSSEPDQITVTPDGCVETPSDHMPREQDASASPSTSSLIGFLDSLFLRSLNAAAVPLPLLFPIPGTVGHRLAKQKLELNEIIIRDLKSVVRAQGAALKDKDAEIAIALATITQLKEEICELQKRNVEPTAVGQVPSVSHRENSPDGWVDESWSEDE